MAMKKASAILGCAARTASPPGAGTDRLHLPGFGEVASGLLP